CQPQISNPSDSYAKSSPFHRPDQGSHWPGPVRLSQARVLPCGTSFHFMLRAALIGFSSSGKTTLFQLMTSVRESARGTGKGENLVGISKVPDERLDRLTAMFNPKKRVPATVEFSDMAATGQAAGAQTLVDVAAYKNADALVHVLRAFQDPAVPHPAGSRAPGRHARGEGGRPEPRA